MRSAASGAPRLSCATSPSDSATPDDPLRIVVVNDMWLTGFDVPVLHTLYIDKPMQDHGLLQAIARVNRVFRDKPGGLVVDYIGIGDDLRAALPAYDAEDSSTSAIPLASLVAELCEKYEVLCAMLYPAGFRRGELTWPQRARDSVRDGGPEHLLARRGDHGALPRRTPGVRKLYALVSDRPAAVELMRRSRFFNRLSPAARKLSRARMPQATAASRPSSQFLSEGLGGRRDRRRVRDRRQGPTRISVLSDEFLD